MDNYYEIPLTQGQVAFVDFEDYWKLAGYRWIAAWSKKTMSYYAMRTGPMENGKPGKSIRMHREILGLNYGDPLHVDHVNCDTLDNRKVNLRVCSRKENARNARRYSTNRSGFKGVGYFKPANKWRSRLRVDGKLIALGLFRTPEDAHAAYIVAAKKYFGEFARFG